MRRWWVMGGTCSGKKTVIRALMADESLRREVGIEGSVSASWYADGEEPPPSFRAPSTENVLVRWQWGREKYIDRERDRIILVMTPIEVAVERAEKREGRKRWSAATLANERANLAELIESKLSGMPKSLVDGTKMKAMVT